MSAKVAFGAIRGIIPVALFALSAVRGAKPIYVKTGRVLKLGRTRDGPLDTASAAVPEIFTGLRVGFSLTLIGTVLGEMFASQYGLGHLLMNAMRLYNVEVIMSVTFLLSFLRSDRERDPSRDAPPAVSHIAYCAKAPSRRVRVAMVRNWEQRIAPCVLVLPAGRSSRQPSLTGLAGDGQRSVTYTHAGPTESGAGDNHGWTRLAR